MNLTPMKKKSRKKTIMMREKTKYDGFKTDVDDLDKDEDSGSDLSPPKKRKKSDKEQSPVQYRLTANLRSFQKPRFSNSIMHTCDI